MSTDERIAVVALKFASVATFLLSILAFVGACLLLTSGRIFLDYPIMGVVFLLLTFVTNRIAKRMEH